MKNLVLKICYLILLSILLTMDMKAQDCAPSGKIINMKEFNMEELEAKWALYMKDVTFKILVENLQKQGFKRIAKIKEFEWGFEGSSVADSTLDITPVPTEICGFDFHKPTNRGGQMASVIWRKVGETTYKAYILFPEKVTDVASAFEKSTEFFVDSKGRINKANSFSKCWSSCIIKRFNASHCTRDISRCSVIASAVALAGLGVTTPVAMGIFATCAGVFCLTPLAVCASICF